MLLGFCCIIRVVMFRVVAAIIRVVVAIIRAVDIIRVVVVMG